MKSIQKSVIFRGTGSYLPKKILSNYDLAKMVETSHEWIFSRTGISERRIATDEESTSYMAIEAAKKALLDANADPKDIDLLIIGTMTPDYLFPATACIVQDKLGLSSSIPAFDLSAACAGFCYCIEVASKMMLSDHYNNVLIICSEKMSSTLDWKDRTTCVLFGDGAGAVVLGKIQKTQVGILGSAIGADGKYFKLLYKPGGGSINHIINSCFLDQKLNFLKMNGKELFKIIIRRLETVITDFLKSHNMVTSDISCFIPHQANLRIIQALSERFNIPIEKFFMNLNYYGNTSAASIPIVLNEFLVNKKIKSGDLVFLIAFGAGLTWAINLIKWH